MTTPAMRMLKGTQKASLKTKGDTQGTSLIYSLQFFLLEAKLSCGKLMCHATSALI